MSSTNRIKLAYDWIGPTRVYDNNQSFTIDSPLTKLRTNHISHEYFERIQGFVPTPSVLLSDSDIFVYELVMGLNKESWFNNPEADLLSTTAKMPHVLDKIRYHNGYILLELGQESLYTEKLIYSLHEYFRKIYIPLNKVIFQVGNPEAHTMYDKYCYERGILKENRMHISTIEYFEFKVSMQMNNPDNIEEPRNLAFDLIEKTFLCFNRNHKINRNNLAVLFHKAGLFKDSYFSMTKNCPSQETHFLHYTRPEYYADCQVTAEDLNELVEKLPMVVDLDDVSDVGKIVNSWGSNQAYYKQSLISVVTESFFDTVIFNTEKIWNPISYKHPFIIAGTPGTLKYLKSLGYKTFGEFWDESYDEVEDPVRRLQQITALCVSISHWTEKEKKDFFYKSMPITEHNYSLLKAIATDTGITSHRRGFWHNFRDAWVYGNGTGFSQINPLST